MSERQRHLLFFLLGAALIAACVWLWFATFEKRWEARSNTSAAARENPMLAATRLLSQRQYSVKTEDTLTEALLQPIPDGILILAGNGGLISPAQATQLFAWVRRGNTLIAQPKWGSSESEPIPEKEDNDEDDTDEDEDKADAAAAGTGKKAAPSVHPNALIESDPIGAHVGVVLGRNPKQISQQTRQYQCKAPDPSEASASASASASATAEINSIEPGKSVEPAKPLEPLPGVTLPNAAYPLQVETNAYRSLRSTSRSRPALFSDADGATVRVYAEGKGHIVMLADNYFKNRSLDQFDHAELLLGLGQLNSPAPAKHVLIVQQLGTISWYQALWANFHLAIVSLGCALALLFWVAVRRFGPILPEPNNERRSLIEHIDASGRWLWKIPGGRDILLAAARAETGKILQRRAPELLRMSEAGQIEYLAQHCKMNSARLVSALQQPASHVPYNFTRQIQTLQQLRNHYER